jgi:hypothetical protein
VRGGKRYACLYDYDHQLVAAYEVVERRGEGPRDFRGAAEPEPQPAEEPGEDLMTPISARNRRAMLGVPIIVAAPKNSEMTAAGRTSVSGQRTYFVYASVRRRTLDRTPGSG